ncbi:hypothetical protein BDU57DRAFT_456053 [Ampelomyces quisqualis]|uniref:Uncharacterized protein n=1 Tax=Ampelomyces quisqualis TaxID=50730 RepID=A0A6A5QDE3_AMPQU|nr:hypothetical protein BDU57DRAFT_456053 [Ampelomyces quisqualis]
MNHNFLGQPTREDLQILDQLRRQLMPMIGVLDKLHADMQTKAFRGEVIDWPHIRYTVSLANNYLTSISAYLNGSYKPREEALRTADGKPMLDHEKNPRIRHIDVATEGAAGKVGALHVFPQAPFPMGNERLAGMAAVLLDKRLGPPEEKWVEERLRKAAEFAYVPGEWGIEANKKVTGDEEQDDDDQDEDEDLKEWYDALFTKRLKGSLNEDQIGEIWAAGHQAAFDRAYQMEKNLSAPGGDEESFEEGFEDEDEDEDEEEMEDDGIEDIGDVDTPEPPPSAPVVMIQRAPPAVHRPVPGVPTMSLGLVHRFMATGEIQG